MSTETVWQIKDKKLSVMQMTGSTITTPASAIGVLRMHCKYFPTPFTTDLTEELEFPEQFEMAPIAYVMRLMAAKEKDYDGVKFWTNEWFELIKDGKRYVNKGQDGTAYTVVEHGFAGD